MHTAAQHPACSRASRALVTLLSISQFLRFTDAVKRSAAAAKEEYFFYSEFVLQIH